MKKIYLFIKGAKRWNSLLKKFSKLHKRLQLLSNSNDTTQYQRLVQKLQRIYSKLEKMQYQTGVKIASTSLAIILSAYTAQAQFAVGELLEGSVFIEDNRIHPTFEDVDGDGDLDLYFGNYEGKIKVYTNNNGKFTDAGFLQAGGSDIDVINQSDPAFADIDGDGDLDLYVGNNYGNIKVYINTNGAFIATADLQSNGSNTIDVGSPAAPAFADIDNDGDLDLFIGKSSGRIETFLNNNGAFTALGNIIAGGSALDGGTFTRPSFADVDGDGDLDLYVGNETGVIKVFINTNTGDFNTTFTPVGDLQADGTALDLGANIWSSPTFADIDADGDLDLYIGESFFGNNIKVFTNNNGLFTSAGNLHEEDATIDVGEYSAPSFADIDADGDLDLYVGKYDGVIKYYMNNNGAFTQEEDLQAGGSTIDVGYNSSPAFADIDGDSDLDMYSGNLYGRVESFTNNNSVFTAAADIQAGGSTIDVGFNSSPTFADIDDDGDLDMYVGTANGNVSVFTNSNGTFTPAGFVQVVSTITDVGTYASPAFADIDDDGDLDLYIGDDYGQVIVLTNANGVFSAGGFLDAGGLVLDVGARSTPTFADIDADGDLDFYVGAADGTITFFENMSIVLVNSISIQSAGNINMITTNGGTLQMSATVLPVNADDDSFTWSVVNGTGSATIDANGLLTAVANGTVEVIATVNDASGETATFVVTISNQNTSVGINDVAFENLSIYPNPTNGILNLDVSKKLTSIQLMDLTGKTIQAFDAEAKQLDISAFTQGIYFLEIANAEKKSVVKIIKK